MISNTASRLPGGCKIKRDLTPGGRKTFRGRGVSEHLTRRKSMKTITDARDDCDDADMTVEQIVARIRWLDEMLMVLQHELAAAVTGERKERLEIA